MMNGGALDSMYEHHVVQRVSFLPKTTLQFHAMYQILGTPLSTNECHAALQEDTFIAA